MHSKTSSALACINTANSLIKLKRTHKSYKNRKSIQINRQTDRQTNDNTAYI